ncbi:MAG: nitrilase-related carbon-nitrogen hydrolase, partial [Acidobacteriota bacterium]
MTELRVAALQMAMTDDVGANVATAERLVRDAAAQGAQIILIPELFEGPYFCKDQLPEHLDRAVALEGHPTVGHFAAVAAELGVVLPLSVYERAGQALFNTVVIVDADGSVLGHYRKSHIPDGPGYTEKYYFSPGDTGFRVWHTRHGVIGVGICWDQWFPETARSMALLGAEVLLFPTAIGSEPPDPTWDSSGHWQRCMQGHAAANVMPLIASNRVGIERGQKY